MDRQQRASVAALVAGITWVLFLTGWVFTHGSTQDPRGGTILSLQAIDFCRLLTVPAVLMLLALAWSGVGGVTGRRSARVAYLAALVLLG